MLTVTLLPTKASSRLSIPDYPEAARKLQSTCRLGRNVQQIEYIILTHADIDHSGSAAELKDITGARVAVHAGDAPRVSSEKQVKDVKGILATFLKAMAALMHFQPVIPDIILREGTEIGRLIVVHTPS